MRSAAMQGIDKRAADAENKKKNVAYSCKLHISLLLKELTFCGALNGGCRLSFC